MLLKVSLLGCCLLLVSGAACAAEIYGQLWVASGKKPPRGAEVFTSCGEKTTVDQYGRYRLVRLPSLETCAVTVQHQDLTSNSVNIYTATHRNRANFMLKVSDDRLLLIRR